MHEYATIAAQPVTTCGRAGNIKYVFIVSYDPAFRCVAVCTVRAEIDNHTVPQSTPQIDLYIVTLHTPFTWRSFGNTTNSPTASPMHSPRKHVNKRKRAGPVKCSTVVLLQELILFPSEFVIPAFTGEPIYQRGRIPLDGFSVKKPDGSDKKCISLKIRAVRAVIDS